MSVSNGPDHETAMTEKSESAWMSGITVTETEEVVEEETENMNAENVTIDDPIETEIVKENRDEIEIGVPMSGAVGEIIERGIARIGRNARIAEMTIDDAVTMTEIDEGISSIRNTFSFSIST